MSQSSLDFSTSEPEYYALTPKIPRHDTIHDTQLKMQSLYVHTGWTKDDNK